MGPHEVWKGIKPKNVVTSRTHSGGIRRSPSPKAEPQQRLRQVMSMRPKKTLLVEAASDDEEASGLVGSPSSVREAYSLMRSTLKRVNFMAHVLQKDLPLPNVPTSPKGDNGGGGNKETAGDDTNASKEEGGVEEMRSLVEMMMVDMSRLQGLVQNAEKEKSRLTGVVIDLKAENESQRKRLEDLLRVLVQKEKEIRGLRDGTDALMGASMGASMMDNRRQSAFSMTGQALAATALGAFRKGKLPRFHAVHAGNVEAPPAHTVTLVLFKVQNSKYLHEHDPDSMAIADRFLAEVLKNAIHRHNGYEAEVFCGSQLLAFMDSVAACAFALEFQDRMMDEQWPADLHKLVDTKRIGFDVEDGVVPPREFLWCGPRVQIAIHAGNVEAVLDPCTMCTTFVGVGTAVVKAVMDTAYGGMIAMSSSVLESVSHSLPDLGDPFVGAHRTIFIEGDDLEVVRMFPRSLANRDCDVHQWESALTAEKLHRLRNTKTSFRRDPKVSGIPRVLTSQRGDNITPPPPTPELTKTFLHIMVDDSDKLKIIPVGSTAIARYTEIVLGLLDDLGQTDFLCNADKFLIPFDSPAVALRFALQVQEVMTAEEWSIAVSSLAACNTVKWDGRKVYSGVRCKAAIHTCSAGLRLGAFAPIYHGDDVCVAAWLSPQAQAGEVILTAAAYVAVYPDLPSCHHPYIAQLGAVHLHDSPSTVHTYTVIPRSLLGRLFIEDCMDDTPAQRKRADYFLLKQSIEAKLDSLYAPVLPSPTFENVLGCVNACWKGSSKRKKESLLPYAECAGLGRHDDPEYDHVCPRALTLAMTLPDLGIFVQRYIAVHHSEGLSACEQELFAVKESMATMHRYIRSFVVLVTRYLAEPTAKADEEVILGLTRMTFELDAKQASPRPKRDVPSGVLNPKAGQMAGQMQGSAWDHLLTAGIEDERTCGTLPVETIVRSGLSHCAKMFVRQSAYVRAQSRILTTALSKKQVVQGSSNSGQKQIQEKSTENIIISVEEKGPLMTSDVTGMMQYVDAHAKPKVPPDP